MRYAVVATLAAVACSPPDPTPTAGPAGNSPVLLFDRTAGPRMEARLGGTLVREGPCIYLRNAGADHLIVWGDAVSVEDGDRGWSIIDRTTGERFDEGERIVGGGGEYPDDAAYLNSIVDPDPPSDCRGRAALLYDVRRFTNMEVPPVVPPPPPPHPSPPSLNEQAKKDGIPIISSTVVRGYSDPQAAILAYLVDYYRDRDGFRGLHMCVDAKGTALEALKRRRSSLKPKDACEWRNGRVVLRENGETGMLIHARVDCAGGTCTGEGGYAVGNQGASTSAFRLVRRGDGWLLQKLGLERIS